MSDGVPPTSPSLPTDSVELSSEDCSPTWRYACCSKCTAKWFSQRRVTRCPRCAAPALPVVPETPPWLRSKSAVSERRQRDE
jgi:hypothetical protein